jgi:hypothetical protein
MLAAIQALGWACTFSLWMWWWKWWHGQVALVVELWQARAWMVLLWQTKAGSHQPRNERSHCWAPPQATLLVV